MNAYELADKLQELDSKLHLIDLFKSANMLRQQADRIAELESCLEFAYKDTMDYYKLNNLGGENNHWLVWARKLLNIEYTTPLTKPLSDEEIAEIYHSENRFSPQGNFAYYGFARAIEKRHGIK